MSKLLKFLKPYAGAVLAILCVLIVQAYCDLSLPTYTSEIVNVGIQQGGGYAGYGSGRSEERRVGKECRL